METMTCRSSTSHKHSLRISLDSTPRPVGNMSTYRGQLRCCCSCGAQRTVTRLTLFSGSETIQERSPIQGGGTAGVTPSELNTPAISFQAAAGDRLKLQIDEVLAGTPTVDGII